jgi:hypothetical protein
MLYNFCGDPAALGNICVAGIEPLSAVDRLKSLSLSLTKMVGNGVAAILDANW